jgi:hypothetical protein
MLESTAKSSSLLRELLRHEHLGRAALLELAVDRLQDHPSEGRVLGKRRRMRPQVDDLPLELAAQAESAEPSARLLLGFFPTQ